MVSELFVPYMDPTESWYFKTYMDAGEYGFGLQAMPLVPLNDCPRHARYLDAVFVAADGRPYVRENMICVFERYAGDIAWRHSESPITGMDVSANPYDSSASRFLDFFPCCLAPTMRVMLLHFPVLVTDE